MLTDTNGFCIPFAGDDSIIECGACDADYGPPESWPDWTDQDRWEPTEADSSWLAAHPILPMIAGGSPAEDDPAGYDEWSRRLEEMHQASLWQDRLEGIYGPGRITDDDVQAAGLPVG